MPETINPFGAPGDPVTRQRPYRCPYCFATFAMAGLRFSCDGGRHQDAGLFASPLGRAHAPCPTCGVEAARPRCGRCHRYLPDRHLETPMLLIALAGPRNSGKTTYLAALFRRLDGALADECGYAMTAADDYTRAALKETFHIGDGEPLAATRRGGGTHMQIVIRLERTPQPGKRFYARGRAKALTVVLFDAEGEDFDATRHHLDYFSQNELGHLAAADAVLFMVDTAAIPGARSAADGSLDSAATTSGEVVEQVTRFLRGPRRRRDDKIDVDAGLVLTKIDLARVDRGSMLRRPRPPVGYQANDRAAVHQELRARLREWEARQTERIIEHAYRDYQLFGVSALGNDLKRGEWHPERINPYRVEDPLLWLLAKAGFLEG